MSDQTAPNTRKIQALLVARTRGWVTAPGFADRCGTTRRAAYAVLSRLTDNGRLEKQDGTVRPGSGSTANRYEITPRGEQYLSYKKDQREDFPQLPRS
jgi:predicted ArsR family transcriptional regulator